MARKDAIELEGTVVELLPTQCSGLRFQVAVACWRIFRQNASALHSDLARRQSYARDFILRFVERANYLSPKMTTRRAAAVFDFANYESTTISKKALCELQNCEAQERRARDLQKPATQATPRMMGAVEY